MRQATHNSKAVAVALVEKYQRRWQELQVKSLKGYSAPDEQKELKRIDKLIEMLKGF